MPAEQVRSRHRFGYPIRVFVVPADKPISMKEGAAPDRVVGTLAFSRLSNSPVVGGKHVRLEPGQILYYDGDQPCSWQSAEKGFGLMMVIWKAGKEKQEGAPSPKHATGVRGAEEE